MNPVQSKFKYCNQGFNQVIMPNSSLSIKNQED